MGPEREQKRLDGLKFGTVLGLCPNCSSDWYTINDTGKESITLNSQGWEKKRAAPECDSVNSGRVDRI